MPDELCTQDKQTDKLPDAICSAPERSPSERPNLASVGGTQTRRPQKPHKLAWLFSPRETDESGHDERRHPPLQSIYLKSLKTSVQKREHSDEQKKKTQTQTQKKNRSCSLRQSGFTATTETAINIQSLAVVQLFIHRIQQFCLCIVGRSSLVFDFLMYLKQTLGASPHLPRSGRGSRAHRARRWA